MFLPPILAGTNADIELIEDIRKRINAIIVKGPVIDSQGTISVNITEAFQGKRYFKRDINALAALYMGNGNWDDWTRLDWSGSRLTPEREGDTVYHIQDCKLVYELNLEKRD